MKTERGPEGQTSAVNSAADPEIVQQGFVEHLAVAYRPLHRGFLLTAIAYYTFITFAHIPDESGVSLLILASISAATAVYGLILWRAVETRQLAVPKLELLSGGMQLLMLFNVLAYHMMHYEASKLVYFPLLAVCFAMSSVTQRSVLVSVIAALGSMLFVVWTSEPAGFGPYVFIAIASAVTCIGLSTLLRGVVQREVIARIRSEAAQKATLELSEKSARLANVDFLTGLPNRRHFMQLLSDRVEQGDAVVVCIVDLDGFKGINDAFGHGAGDEVLVEVARRLQADLQLEPLTARIGGDEFGIIIPGHPDPERLQEWAHSLLSQLKVPFYLDAAVARISGSLGIASSLDSDSAESILDRADYAAYEAKHHQKGGLVVFDQDHQRSISETHKIERALMQADFENEIVPVFQPIVNAQTGHTEGYETLARWHSPELGNVSPADFIPIAERLGLIPRVTQHMVRKAIDLAAQLPGKLRVSVNLSMHDLASADAMCNLSAILAASTLKPCRIDFEITETAVMHDSEEATAALNVLLAHGARISLDDFGTGHSSLSRVQTLPLNRIKIDQCFVANIETSRASQAIVKTTLDLCQNLGISCVVEGTETAEQIAALQALGATLFQGYYFSRPIGLDAVLERHSGKASVSAA